MELIHDYQQKNLIEPLKLMGYFHQDDESKLAELQHHGAATQFVDFTENPLVALWFACSERNEGKGKRDGKIFVADIGNTSIWKNGRLQKEWLGKPAQEYIYYEPDRSLSNRIPAQSSLFLMGNPHIRDLDSITIAADDKQEILKRLKWMKIFDDALFPDVHRIASLNNVKTRLTIADPNPETHKRLGRLAFDNKRFKEALDYFSRYVMLMPDAAEPYWLKGNALAEFKEAKRYEQAIEEYNKAIEFKDNPLPPAPIKLDWLIDCFHGTYCYNRGNAYAALEKHKDAISDFTETIQLTRNMSNEFAKNLRRDAYHNKANSHFMLGQFKEAQENFKLSDQYGRDEAKLGMGNSALLQADNPDLFRSQVKEALAYYRAGVNVRRVEISEHCQANLNSLEAMMETVGDKEIISSHMRNKDGIVITIVVRNLSQTSFSFAGNAGNVGNWGGGGGYCGFNNFKVTMNNYEPELFEHNGRHLEVRAEKVEDAWEIRVYENNSQVIYDSNTRCVYIISHETVMDAKKQSFLDPVEVQMKAVKKDILDGNVTIL